MVKGSCGAMCCGGMALFIQSLHSVDPNAYAFIQGCGTIMKKELAAGETIVVDGDSILAMTNEVTMDIQFAGGCLAACCGGEGLFNTEMKGPGTIYLQSFPIEKLLKLFPQRKEGGGKGEGGGADGAS